ncbi:RagB/SusD family nutrient uptake outer membrane protein [uncultured Bacteroides sp.]|uniref:RagB/SusD family nutrient uptake outer membrane protein n=1 Tax=uncultured Bacteroides sp. TaxID=162156 RepID=UPI0025D3AAC6|nr:RagB/SusD family nutrient uptake outer membrane protein [uncultured Bacteroides sp.]
MKRYKLICALCAFAAVGFTACDLTEEPTSMYEKDTFFDSEAKAKMAVVGIYDCLAIDKHYGQFEMAMPCSDDVYYIQGTGTDGTRRDIAHYTVTNTNQWIASCWEYKYQAIDRANFAIAGIEGMAGYSEENTVLQELIAQARFLRAFMAFDLVKYWGDVPFKTTYSSGYGDAFQPRTDRELIYDEIIKDLNFAKDNLQQASAALSPEVPSQGAAHALLMRVLLQRAGYSLHADGTLQRPDDATRKSYFDAVITEWKAFQQKGYHDFFTGGYEALFKTYSEGVLNSQESLWEIAFEPKGGLKENAGTWATYNGPLVAAPDGIKPADNGKYMGRANAFFRILPAWKDFFEEGDERRDVLVVDYEYTWNKNKLEHVKKVAEKKIDTDGDGENDKTIADVFKWCPGKWRREWMPLGFVDPNNTGVNYCPLRYADVVLMAAEAYNETGDTGEAWRLLNMVRGRAKATQIDGTNYAAFYKAPKVYDLPFIADGDEAGKFRTALFWERGFELACEGQRKYDLIRWGVLAESLKSAQDHIQTNPDWVTCLKGKYIAGDKFKTGKHELFPIPLSELQSNASLEGKNNPGY